MNSFFKNFTSILLSLLFITPSAYAFVNIKRTLTINLEELKGSESALELLTRVENNLNTNFKIEKSDFTYNFLERYFQLYTNEPKGIFNEPVILTAKYNAKKDLIQSDVKFHYTKKNAADIESTIVNSKLRILKSTKPLKVAFEFKSDYSWVVKKLINLYLSFGDGSKFIQDFAKTTILLDNNNPNNLIIELEYVSYGSHIQPVVVEELMVFTKDVVVKFIEELRQ